MGSHNNLILVEGKDDLHVIGHLLDQHQIPCAPANRSPRPPDAPTIFLQEEGGISKLLQSLKLRLNNSDLKRVGLVLDADEHVGQRWQAVCDHLRRIGQIELPTQPAQNGFVTTLYLQKHEVVVGIWLMPSNTTSGILEDFVQSLIPQSDSLWQHAQTSVASLPQRLFATSKQSKAEIHTWLAWQEDPGRPMGEAVKQGVLSVTAVSAQTFITWVRRTFALPTTPS